MVPGGGIEPPTPGFSNRCSTPELPRRDIFPWGPDPALTCRGQGFAVRQRPALRGPSGAPGKTSMFVSPYPGRGGGDRTRDLSPPRRARYQAALHPVQDRWSGQSGSNRRHSDWKSDALPAELYPRNRGARTSVSLMMVPGKGFEPPRPFGRRHLRPACLPFHHPGMGMNRTGILAPQDGFEPPTR